MTAEQAASGIESEMPDVAVGDDVFLAFRPDSLRLPQEVGFQPVSKPNHKDRSERETEVYSRPQKSISSI
jgi:hypothetical protein